MSRLRPPPMYRVRIVAHTIPPRYVIPGRSCKLSSISVEGACERVVLWAHADAGAPPWRPYVRHSLAFTTAKQVAPAGEWRTDYRIAA